jgi:hypothetical protein
LSIPDPKTATKERGEKIFVVLPVPEIIDTVFAKTSQKRSFSITEYGRFGLVFTKTRVYKFGHCFCSHKNQNIENYINFELAKTKIGPIYKRVLEFSIQKIVIELSKIWVWNGIRDPEKTYSDSRIQGSKRHRIPDPDPQHCNFR